jgi:hypothetical protein
VARLKTISEFKSTLAGGGARPNLFEVELTKFPDAIPGWDADKFQYLCKAANLPASTIASIDVPFRGRTFKVAGDRSIDVWTVTVINDEDFKLRRSFEAWMELIAKLDNNLGATNPSSYMSNATVHQLGRGSTVNSTTNAGADSAILASYNFVDIFPTAVSAIDLSYDSGDTIEEFTVEFQVQSFELISGATAAQA